MNVLRKFEEKNPGVREKDTDTIEAAFQEFCKGMKSRDERFVSKDALEDTAWWTLTDHSIAGV